MAAILDTILNFLDSFEHLIPIENKTLYYAVTGAICVLAATIGLVLSFFTITYCVIPCTVPCLKLLGKIIYYLGAGIGFALIGIFIMCVVLLKLLFEFSRWLYFKARNSKCAYFKRNDQTFFGNVNVNRQTNNIPTNHSAWSTNFHSTQSYVPKFNRNNTYRSTESEAKPQPRVSVPPSTHFSSFNEKSFNTSTSRANQPTFYGYSSSQVPRTDENVLNKDSSYRPTENVPKPKPKPQDPVPPSTQFSSVNERSFNASTSRATQPTFYGHSSSELPRTHKKKFQAAQATFYRSESEESLQYQSSSQLPRNHQESFSFHSDRPSIK